MIVTQFPDRLRRRCSNLVLRRAPRLHDMKSASAWPAKLAMLVTQRRESPVCQDRPQGRSAWKKQLPRESCFFRGLDWRGVSMLHRTAIPLVTQLAASCLASGDLLVLHLKIDIFCHLSIFFLTSALSPEFCSAKREAGTVRLTVPAFRGVFHTQHSPFLPPERRRQPHGCAAARRFEDRKEKQFMYQNHYGYNTTGHGRL